MNKNTLQSRQWYESLSYLLKEVGGDRFYPVLSLLLSEITPFENAVIIAYEDNERPLHIFNDLPSEQIAPTLDRYFNGAYLLDPFYQACQNHQPEGVYRLRNLAPDEFYESEYYRNYYEGTHLTEEVGILVEVTATLRVVISLGIRTDGTHVTLTDLTALETCWSLLGEICRQHWRVQNFTGARAANDSASDRTYGASLDLTFQNFGKDHLSDRECQIVQMILKGHSSRSMAELLHITTDTVKAHRKHIHNKLDVSSQAELFSLFLDAIAVAPIGSLGDPLTTFLKGRYIDTENTV